MSMDMGSMAGMDVSQIFNMFSRMGGMGGRSGNVQFKVHCTTGGGGIGMDISQLFGGLCRHARPGRPSDSAKETEESSTSDTPGLRADGNHFELLFRILLILILILYFLRLRDTAIWFR